MSQGSVHARSSCCCCTRVARPATKAQLLVRVPRHYGAHPRVRVCGLACCAVSPMPSTQLDLQGRSRPTQAQATGLGVVVPRSLFKAGCTAGGEVPWSVQECAAVRCPISAPSVLRSTPRTSGKVQWHGTSAPLSGSRSDVHAAMHVAAVSHVVLELITVLHKCKRLQQARASPRRP